MSTIRKCSRCGKEFSYNEKADMDLWREAAWIGDRACSFEIICRECHEKEEKESSSEAIKISIVDKGKISERIRLCEVGIHITPEFRNEPDFTISKEQKIEVVAQKIKDKFIEFLTKENL